MKKLRLSARIQSFLKKGETPEECKKAFDEAVEAISKIDGIDGVELNYPTVFTIPVEDMKEIFEKYNLKVSAVNPRFYEDKLFKTGALAHPEKEIRDAAIKFVNDSVSASRVFDCDIVNIWINRDGHTYPFERDYSLLWKNFVDSMQKVADNAKDIKFGLEYKYEQSPVKTLVRDAGRTVVLIHEIDRPNVGANMDYNHSIMCQECPGEAYEMFLSRNKLFNVHLNDSWYYDDDIMVGSVTPVSLLEVFYLFRKYDYDGWIFFDTKVVSGTAEDECRENVETVQQFWRLANNIDLKKLEELRAKEDVCAIKKMIRELLFK
ncbi:MAG: TIM barrel protein [Candidatus Omnitrophica bacterium]|nr:TIM barrel protein [Candidatus Omnitrophota bacterium]